MYPCLYGACNLKGAKSDRHMDTLQQFPHEPVSRVRLLWSCEALYINVAYLTGMPRSALATDPVRVELAAALRALTHDLRAHTCTLASEQERLEHLLQAVFDQIVLRDGVCVPDWELGFFELDFKNTLSGALQELRSPGRTVRLRSALAADLMDMGRTREEATREAAAHHRSPFHHAHASNRRRPRRTPGRRRPGQTLPLRAQRRREHRATRSTPTSTTAGSGESPGPSDPDPAPSCDGNDPPQLAACIQGIIRLPRVARGRSPFRHFHQGNFHQGTGGRS